MRSAGERPCQGIHSLTLAATGRRWWKNWKVVEELKGGETEKTVS
jgi:hypothetical protein